MQVITMYLRATSVKAALVDEWNQAVGVLPALTRGLRAELVLKLLDENGGPLTGLDYASWDFAIANDWDTSTTPQLRVTEGITVTENEVHVPLTETNTEELVAALGKDEQATFGCELAGFTTGETSPEFLIQFDIIVRNRRADAGTGRPVPVGDGSYTAAQIRSLFAARLEVELSDDGSAWYAADPSAGTPDAARWYRFRNAAVGLEWSDPLPLVPGPRGQVAGVSVGEVKTVGAGAPAKVTNTGTEHDAVLAFEIPRGETGSAATVRVGTVSVVEPSEAGVSNSGTTTAAVLDFRIPRGPQGETGHSDFIYVAYASRSDGAGFSLVPGPALKYRAEIQCDEPLENPTLADFAGARWIKYLGDDATVFGDVLVADGTTSVPKVTRLVFENASVRMGVDGEAIVNFRKAGPANAPYVGFAVVNARTRLSPWTNGGGSVSALPGLEGMTLAALAPLADLCGHSVFIG